MRINKITSITSHVSGDGQRLSYTYSVIDGDTGQIISDNNRGNLVILEEMEGYGDLISHIKGMENYVKSKMEA